MKYKIIDVRLNDFSFGTATVGSNAIDLRACLTDSLILHPGEEAVVHTGIAVQLPEKTMGMIIPRSSVGFRGLVLGNSVGNIDPDYRGEIKLALWNRSQHVITVEPFERIAQLVVVKVHDPWLWECVDELDNTERGTNGFGSTGTK